MNRRCPVCKPSGTGKPCKACVGRIQHVRRTVEEWLPILRNPAVGRSLAEQRGFPSTRRRGPDPATKGAFPYAAGLACIEAVCHGSDTLPRQRQCSDNVAFRTVASAFKACGHAVSAWALRTAVRDRASWALEPQPSRPARQAARRARRASPAESRSRRAA